MAEVSNPGTPDLAPDAPILAAPPVPPPQQAKWYRWRKDGVALVNYLLDSEVHTFAFSVAANAILSFIPFMVLLYKLAKFVFKSPTMIAVVTDTIRYFFPVSPGNEDLIASLLTKAAFGNGVQVLSLVMILISCTGIFLPLEVALNQAWGVTKSRNYLHNQVIAFGLAILMVVLALAAILLSAWERQILAVIFLGNTDNFVFQGINYIWLAATTGAASILFFFSIYWLLPNRKIPPRQVMRTSIYTGLIWLVSKYLFVLILPHLDLRSIYGGFNITVGILFWSYVSGLILFAGAQFSVARLAEVDSEKPQTE
jgi:membrane protein/epoxyqueuosine reductase